MGCNSEVEALQMLRGNTFFQGKKYLNTLVKSIYITLSQVEKNSYSSAMVERLYNIFLEELVLEINRFFPSDTSSEEMLVE